MSTTYRWMVVALLSGMLASFAMLTFRSRAWRMFWRLSPVIDFPTKLDLGAHEKGETVIVPFTIANRGGGDLLIDEIASNCGCTGMERKENGRYIKLESLRLKSEENAQLVMRVSVGGPLGGVVHNFVAFRTNDPDQPNARIEVVVSRVSGGVFTTPEAVVFGTIPAGTKVCQFVDIRDPAESSRAIKRVSSTGSDQISVRLLPATDLPNKNETKTESVLVGRLEVTLEANHPSNIDASISIEVEGREEKPDNLPIVGRVTALFEMRPSLIVLPRSTTNGLVYHATCLCKSFSGKPVTLTVDSLPVGMTAKVLAEVSAGETPVEIAYNPCVAREQTRSQRQRIRFRVKDGKNEAVLDLPIILQK